MPDLHSRVISDAVKSAATCLDTLRHNAALLNQAAHLARLIAQRIRDGHKVMICGNGGSSCDANHFAEELTGRFRADRPPLPAIACTDVGHITCTANDYGFDHIFERWVQALGKPGDVLIVLSTSGNSTNIAQAASAGHKLGMYVTAMLGKDGGIVHDSGTCDQSFVVPGETSDRIQELHMLLLHAIVEAVEVDLFPS